MYVSMYVYVPGGALRLKRCVIDAPFSPSAASFCFAIFFSWWCFRRASADFFEPPLVLPPLLRPAFLASFPALILGIAGYGLTI